MRALFAVLVLCGATVLAAPTESAAQIGSCWSCVGTINGNCPTCSGAEVGWENCQQPYCGYCGSYGDECGVRETMAPDGSGHAGSLPTGSPAGGVWVHVRTIHVNGQAFTGHAVRRSCDMAIVLRKYSPGLVEEIRRQARIMII